MEKWYLWIVIAILAIRNLMNQFQKQFKLKTVVEEVLKCHNTSFEI